MGERDRKSSYTAACLEGNEKTIKKWNEPEIGNKKKTYNRLNNF